MVVLEVILVTSATLKITELQIQIQFTLGSDTVFPWQD